MVVAFGLSCSMVCKIFLDQGWSSVPCIGKQILIHCATRETLFNLKKFFVFFFFLIFWPLCTVCGILVPEPGIQPAAPTVGALKLNYWTAKEFPWWGISIGGWLRWKIDQIFQFKNVCQMQHPEKESLLLGSIVQELELEGAHASPKAGRRKARKEEQGEGYPRETRNFR